MEQTEGELGIPYGLNNCLLEFVNCIYKSSLSSVGASADVVLVSLSSLISHISHYCSKCYFSLYLKSSSVLVGMNSLQRAATYRKH